MTTTTAIALRRIEAARRLGLLADLLREPTDAPIRGAAALLAGGPGMDPDRGGAVVTVSIDTAAQLDAIVDLLVDRDTVPTYCVACARHLGVDFPVEVGRYRCDRCRRKFIIGGLR